MTPATAIALLLAALALVVLYSKLDRLFTYTFLKTIVVWGSHDELVKYLADFTTTAEWDPNVKTARKISENAFELTTLFRGNASTMAYLLTGVVQKGECDSIINLKGESGTAIAIDTIRLTADSVVDMVPRTRIVYKLEVSLKGWRRPFGRLIGGELEALGSESLDGLVSTCALKFGPKDSK